VRHTDNKLTKFTIMKTLTSIAATLLMVVSFSSFANEEPAVQKLTMDYALKTYIDAMTSGKVKGFAEILDSDVKFTITHGEKIVNYNRAEMLGAMKGTENVVQNCSTDYTIVEQNNNQAIVKVIMKYDTFTRINFVTMAQTKKGWKITNVSSAFV
jgi:hypothetical protein